jgi:hypothetical protein
MKYLYGASVQGIQEFITQTGRLKEVVGASELVEQICTSLFLEMAGVDENDPNIIRNAAGNIRYIFDEEADCRSFVRDFSRSVRKKAPGVRITQAVLTFGPDELATKLRELELKLTKLRSRADLPLDIGYMGLERCRRTGNVAVRTTSDEEYICQATVEKLSASGSNNQRLLRKLTGELNLEKERFPLDMEMISKGEKKDWIAVIHADGNGMGNIVQALGQMLIGRNNNAVALAFSDFSKLIDRSTTAAVRHAFASTFKKEIEKRSEYIPVRPLVMGGDDVSLIIRADKALSFCNAFMEHFELSAGEALEGFRRSHDLEQLPGTLTVCAGIAFVKSSYPFHYAFELAEELCAEAKKSSKKQVVELKLDVIPSSLSFIRMQDSFIEDKLSDIRERTQGNGGVTFNYGPYYLRQTGNTASLTELRNKLDLLRDLGSEVNEGPMSKLRKWVTEASRDPSLAEFLMDRIKQNNENFYKALSLEDHRKGKSIIHELIQIHSLES